jgi:hypothetical protein
MSCSEGVNTGIAVRHAVKCRIKEKELSEAHSTRALGNIKIR